MDSELLERILAEKTGTGFGRPIEELVKSEDPLRGAESQRMRTYFSSHEMIPSRDLDDYGKLLFLGDIAGVKQECARRVAALREGEVDEEEATIRAGKEQADLRWGPTRVPIYDLLLLARELVPSARCNILRVARYLIDDAKVPVGSKDLSGTTAIAHAIGTKPTFDPELAQILYDAGEDVNGRNRYGCTAGHDIAMVGQSDLSIAAEALRSISRMEEMSTSRTTTA